MHILACTRRLTCRSVHSCLISCGLFYTGHENRSSYFAYVILREGPCLTSKSSSNGFVFAGHMSISFNLFLSRVESTITSSFLDFTYLSTSDWDFARAKLENVNSFHHSSCSVLSALSFRSTYLVWLNVSHENSYGYYASDPFHFLCPTDQSTFPRSSLSGVHAPFYVSLSSSFTRPSVAQWVFRIPIQIVICSLTPNTDNVAQSAI